MAGFSKLAYLFGDFKRQWTIGLAKPSENFRPEDSAIQWQKVDPEFYFIADPFLFEFKNCTFIFFEALEKKYRKGVIYAAEVSGDLQLKNITKIIEEKYHLSYPQGFQFNDKLYCLPEAHQSGKLFLYEAVEFPFKWKKCSAILELPCVDATLFFHEKKFWLFFTLFGKNAENKELHIAFANDLFGEWKMHPKNPVVNSLNGSRPAGPLFFKDEKIFRPAQNCTSKYGENVMIHEVLKLNENEYSEKLKAEILPYEKFPEGLHHYCFTKKLLAIDGGRLKFRFKTFSEFKSNLHNILQQKFFYP